MPSCDQTGVPIHFHPSTTSGSGSCISLHILPRVAPRQSPSSAILSKTSSDAGWTWLVLDSFRFSSWKVQTKNYVIASLLAPTNVKITAPQAAR